jgi:hypothetical protein
MSTGTGINYQVIYLLAADQAVGGMLLLMLPGGTYTHVTLEHEDGTRLRYAVALKDEPEPHERGLFGLPPKPATGHTPRATVHAQQ